MADTTLQGITRIGRQEPGKRMRFGWKSELKEIIEKNNMVSFDGRKTVGILTRKLREQVLYMGFNELRMLGFRIEKPSNFRTQHLRTLVAYWESQDLVPATIQNRISVFRIFADWIGKGNMIKASELYASSPDKVTRSNIAEVDKSWSTNSVDFNSILAQIEEYDIYAGAQLRMIKAFGLRRLEAICFKPNRHWIREDLARGAIRVRDGTKGGRERVLLVETDEQLAALEHAVAIVGPQINRSIGYPGLSLEQSASKYSYIMRKFGLSKDGLGVTGHGLRHQFANEEYEKLTGQPSPVRGGKKEDVDKAVDIAARYKVTEKLGHSRVSVTPSYYGSHRAKSKAKNKVNTTSSQDVINQEEHSNG